MIAPPSPIEIRRLRNQYGLSRAEAAALIYKSVRSWEKWETGERVMDAAFFELFKIKLLALPAKK